MAGKWKSQGRSGGFVRLFFEGVIPPFTSTHTVRDELTGETREISVHLGQSVGDAISKGQWKNRDRRGRSSGGGGGSADMPPWLILLLLAPILIPIVVFVLPVFMIKLMIVGQKDQRPAERRSMFAQIGVRLGLAFVGTLSFKFGYSLAVVAWVGIAPYILDSARNSPDFFAAHGWLETTLVLATLLWSTAMSLMGVKLIALGRFSANWRNASPHGHLDYLQNEPSPRPAFGWIMNVVFGIVALLVVIGAVQETPTPSLHVASAISGIDFRDFAYPVGPPFCDFFGNAVTVRNGKFTNSEASFEVTKITYSDLTHERNQQAVVETWCSPNNAANPGADVSLVYVYGLRNGHAALLGTFADGWPWNFQNKISEPMRADGIVLMDVRGIHVEGGAISFERFGGHARCCPEINLKQTFRWRNGRFVLAKATETPWKEQ